MEAEAIIKKMKSYGIVVAEQYFKPSKTETKAFEDLFKVIDARDKLADKLAKEIENKQSHVPLVNLNPPSLTKIKEL